MAQPDAEALLARRRGPHRRQPGGGGEELLGQAPAVATSRWRSSSKALRWGPPQSSEPSDPVAVEDGADLAEGADGGPELPHQLVVADSSLGTSDQTFEMA